MTLIQLKSTYSAMAKTRYTTRKIVFTALLISFSLTAQSQSIFEVACKGNMVALDSLLQNSTINIKSKNGSTLLHFATYCRQEKVFESLLQKGIKIDERNKFGETPLFYAAQRQNIKMVKTLLDKGADVNNVNEDGHTAIYQAVRSDNQEFLDLLLRANADVNLGMTSLHSAVLNDNIDIVKKLINKETNVDVLNEYGNTPLAIAMRQGNVEISELLLSNGADRKKIPPHVLKNEYVGQKAPDTIPAVFARNFISTEDFVHSPTFSPKGDEIYYTLESRAYNGGTIMMSQRIHGQWTPPTPAAIDGDYREIDPFLSPDNTRMYYSSNRPRTATDTVSKNIDLWMVKREGQGWSTPTHLGDAVNTPDADWFPTVSKKGTLFFSTGPNRTGNIVYSELKNGQYQKAIALGDSVNSTFNDYDPIISPDERFVIFSSNRPGGFGSVDLYVSFKNEDNSWTKAKNLGPAVNTKTIEFAPRLSHDGNYLFFNRKGDIYWVSTEIIQNLR